MKELINISFTPQSSCLYPRYKRIRNAFTNEDKTICYGCGKCWNCIQSFRESWRIRLYESMIASAYTPIHGFIYDTFTIAPASLPSFSAHDYWTGESVVPPEWLHEDKIWEIIDHYDGRVPCLPKETFSYFIKKGRERYNSFYRKEIKAGTCSRCKLRVFAALEYGPKWARPHVHMAVFGVKYNDWVQFWSKFWRREMGFTKTKFIDLNEKRSEMSAHCSRVSTYISKYLLKGSYENVLVRAGICPPAWRVVSHGIGEEYLTIDLNDRFKWLSQDVKYCWGNTISIDDNNNSEIYQDVVSYCKQKFLHLSTEQINSLKTYVQNGYKYALPRYYTDRLCAVHRKGLSGCSIKAALLENAEHDSFEKILQYATESGQFPGKSEQWIRHKISNDLRAFNIVAYRYVNFKKIQDIRRAERNRISTLNTKNRLFAKSITGDLGLLL